LLEQVFFDEEILVDLLSMIPIKQNFNLLLANSTSCQAFHFLPGYCDIDKHSFGLLILKIILDVVCCDLSIGVGLNV